VALPPASVPHADSTVVEDIPLLRSARLGADARRAPNVAASDLSMEYGGEEVRARTRWVGPFEAATRALFGERAPERPQLTPGGQAHQPALM